MVAATEVAVAVIVIAGRSRCLFLFEILGMPCGASIACRTRCPASAFFVPTDMPIVSNYTTALLACRPEAVRKEFERWRRFRRPTSEHGFANRRALPFSGTARFATYTFRRTSTPKSPKALHLSSSLTDVTPR